jgi:hypothetical protein
MSWYNPFSWLTKNSLVVKLICDNPYCGEPILERDVIYDRKRDKVYHNQNCARVYAALLSAQSFEHVYPITEHISRKRVFNIRKSKGLEENVSK